MAELEIAVGLDPTGVGAWLAIAATFVCEGGALVLLWTRWGWAPAVVFILPFHLAIGLTGFAYYVDFSMLMLAMFVTLYDDERIEPLRRIWGRFHPAFTRLRGARRALPALVTLLAYLYVGWSTNSNGFGPQILIAFIFGTLLYAGLAMCAIDAVRQQHVSGPRPLRALPLGLAGLTVLFFLNGASPYLGFKTESSMAMYSNLRTEGTSNHLFVPEGSQLTKLQTPVRIARTNIQSLKRYRRKGVGVTWFELWRAVKASPAGYVEYEVNGTSEIYDGRSGAGGKSDSAPYAPSWILEKLWRFKPVRFRTPQPCTH
jgi:hypothetical protein